MRQGRNTEKGRLNTLLRRGAVIAIFIAAINSALAQDVHFSQYFNVPLSLNPALTGKVDGTFRIGIDYRNQWSGIGARTYSTPSFYGDVPVRFKSKDMLGIGINIVSDKSSGGMLSSVSGVISIAYHKAMGGSKNHFLSIGAQLGFIQKKLDMDKIRLGDQIDLQKESINASADFNSLDGNDGGLEFSAGFDWSSKFSEHAAVNLGYAAYHLTQPEIVFYASENLPIRHNFSFEADFVLAEHFSLHPFLLYMSQAKTNETFAGLSAGIPFNDNSGLYLGAYFRVNDAVAAYAGFDIKGVNLGFSYDITTSSLEGTNGGFEISLTYTGRYVPVPDVTPSMYCPRF